MTYKQTSEQASRHFSSTDIWSLAARPITFMRPGYTAKSGWHEHIPFAFWLTEAHEPRCIVELGCHYGVSYFAFCQAVQALGLDTRCYGIDTWKGDEHAGFYGESVYKAVETHNNNQFSSFSRLVRSTFDQALKHFPDGQIDLLHIDGHHSFESALQDFNSWLPKLSNRAIVILHDTNVRERGFGVYRLFSELREIYPSFEFLHGHGLGALAIGSEHTKPLQVLFNMKHNTEAEQSFRELFSRVGRACADAYSVEHFHPYVEALEKTIRDQKASLEENQKRLEAQTVEVQTERTKREKAHSSLADISQNILHHQQSNLREIREHRIFEVKVLEDRLNSTDLQLVTAKEESRQLRNLLEETKVQLSFSESSQTELRKLASLNKDEQEEHKTSLKQFEKQISDLESQLAAEREVWERNMTNSQNMLDEANKNLLTGETTIQRLKSDHDRALAELRSELDERFKEIAQFTRILQERDGMVEQAQIAIRKAAAVAIGKFAMLPNGKAMRLPLLSAWRERRVARRFLKNGLVNPEWYLETHADVAKAGMDPARHYVRFGAKEGREPNSWLSENLPPFSTKISKN